jgi:competence protein ComEC
VTPLFRFVLRAARWASAFAGDGSRLPRSDSIGNDTGIVGSACSPLRHVRHYRPLLWPSVAALVGASLPHRLSATPCILDHVSHHRLQWIVGFLLLCAGLAFLFRALSKASSFPGKVRPTVALVLTLGAFALGFGRGLHWCRDMHTVSGLASDGRPLSVMALALDSPKVMGAGSSLLVLVLDARVAGGTRDMAGETSGPIAPDSPVVCFAGHRVIVRTRVAPDSLRVRAGDVVSVTGRLTVPEPAMNPGQFDYRRYLLSKRILSLLDGHPSPLSLTEQAHRSWSWFLILRQGAIRARVQLGGSVRNLLNTSLPPEDAAVIQAMLLADDGELDEKTQDDFERSGLRRFLSLTGFHVDAVSWATFSLVQRATKKYKMSRLLAMASAATMVWLSGQTAGAIRASVSVAMRFGAPMVRRKYDPLAALSVGTLLVAWAIPCPIGDVGVNLSLAGALGAWFGRRYWRSGILGMVAMLVPLMTRHFREVSAAGLVAGGLWASVVSSVAILVLFILALPWGMTVLGWIPYLISRGVVALVSLVSRIPLASVSFPALSWGEIVSWYGLLALWAWHLEACREWKGGRGQPNATLASIVGNRGQIRKILVLVAAFSLSVCAWFRAYPQWPKVVFLSVGQGDSAVIRYKDVCILVDTGTETQFQRFVLPYLRFSGVKRIDLCVLSHLHSDHAGGTRALCAEFDVGTLVTMPGTARELQESLGRRDIPTVEPRGSGTLFAMGSLRLVAEPLGSVGTSPSAGGNEACLALFLRAGEAIVEFWADLPAPLISEYLERTSFGEARTGAQRIVKVPHHGSVDGLVPDLYSGGPECVAVISVGSNSYGHPSPDVVECLESGGSIVFRTDRDGAVEATAIGGQFRVFSYVGGRKLGRLGRIFRLE